MQCPRQSLGDSNTQPSTPCSASVECGGNRSTFEGSANSALRRRAFLKSAGALPAASVTESITRRGDRNWHREATVSCFVRVHRLFTTPTTRWPPRWFQVSLHRPQFEFPFDSWKRGWQGVASL